jgi:hypothetical protein
MHEHDVGLEAKFLGQADRLAPSRPKDSGLFGFHRASMIHTNDTYRFGRRQVAVEVLRNAPSLGLDKRKETPDILEGGKQKRKVFCTTFLAGSGRIKTLKAA